MIAGVFTGVLPVLITYVALAGLFLLFAGGRR
jgi:hypothetical protein